MAEQSLVKEHTEPAWRGGKEDLLRMGEMIDRQMCAAADRKVIDEAAGRSRWKLLMTFLRGPKGHEAPRNAEVLLELENGEHRISKGEYHSLISESGLEDVVKVRYQGSQSDRVCHVSMSTSGVFLRIEGPPAWAREAYENVLTTIRHNRPGWWWLKRAWFTWLLFVLGWSTFMFGVYLSDFSGWRSWLLLAAFVAVPILIGLTIAKWFPRFELVVRDRPPARRRVARWAAGVAAACVTILSIISGVVTLTSKS